VQYTAAGLISGAPRPMSIPEAIRAAAPRPALIIAGGAVTSEPIAARWFQAASPATVHVWVVPHAGHTQGLATAPQAWAAHVISFLNTALRTATPATPAPATTASPVLQSAQLRRKVTSLAHTALSIPHTASPARRPAGGCLCWDMSATASNEVPAAPTR
jgi:hypothetical protein